MTWGLWHDRRKIRAPDAEHHAAIITKLAGIEAEVELLGGSIGGDGDDLYNVAMLLDNLGHDDPDKLQARLRAITRMLVRRHRHRIERVATELPAKGKLTAKRIDRLAGRSIVDIGMQR